MFEAALYYKRFYTTRRSRKRQSSFPIDDDLVLKTDSVMHRNGKCVVSRCTSNIERNPSRSFTMDDLHTVDQHG